MLVQIVDELLPNTGLVGATPQRPRIAGYTNGRDRLLEEALVPQKAVGGRPLIETALVLVVHGGARRQATRSRAYACRGGLARMGSLHGCVAHLGSIGTGQGAEERGLGRAVSWRWGPRCRRGPSMAIAAARTGSLHG